MRQNGFELHFSSKDNITLEMLNDAYGKFGVTFESKAQAENYAAKHPGSFISRLIDGANGAFYETAWLVTLPRSYRSLME